MNFDESVKYLYSLGNEVEAMKLGLENIRTLLAALGNRQNSYLKVQVAGTNGKGSVCAFLDAICLSAGIRTGLYTSPHLISITERIKIGGQDVSEADLARYATHIRETAERLLGEGELEYRPTFFEQITAIALAAFAEAKVELAILETGLGGRLDATTAADAEIAAITPIDIDHQEYLGNTLAEIAAEKAAIIRADSKIIIAPQKKAAERAILGRCNEIGVEPVWVKEDFEIKRDTDGYLYTVFRTNKDNYFVKLFMLGRHQFINAATALAVAECLDEFGFDIPPESIDAGLGSATHPGRLEHNGNFLFDGAHNIGGARALREYLDEFVTQPITLVFGSMKDKQISEIAAILFPAADKVILTRPDNSRAMTAEEIAEFTPLDFDRNLLVLTETVKDALKQAANEELVLVTGSLYLVGEAAKDSEKPIPYLKFDISNLQ